MRCAHILILHERAINLVSDTNSGCWRRPLLSQICAQSDPPPSKNAGNSIIIVLHSVRSVIRQISRRCIWSCQSYVENIVGLFFFWGGRHDAHYTITHGLFLPSRINFGSVVSQLLGGHTHTHTPIKHYRASLARRQETMFDKLFTCKLGGQKPTHSGKSPKWVSRLFFVIL